MDVPLQATPILRDRAMVRALAVLAVTQIVAWGTIGFPTVLAPEIAEELAISIPAVFAGPAIMSVTAALVSPAFGAQFIRFGARLLMVAGAFLAAPGLAIIAASAHPIGYFTGWILIGTGSATMLSTGAHIYLSERVGAAARGPIGALMVMTGLSSAIFLPLTALLDHALGWRLTVLVFAGLLVFINAGLCWFVLPSAGFASSDGPAEDSQSVPRTTSRPDRSIFGLIASAVALNAFVTFGFSAVLIQLFDELGFSRSAAVGLGSLLSVAQVSARGLDLVTAMIWRRNWDGLTVGRLASAGMVLALAILMLGGGHTVSTVGFIVLYGMSSGMLAVARSTIPLVFYDRVDYARVLSRIGLPLNLTVAASPPLMAAVLEHHGAQAMLGLALAVSIAALALLLALARRRARLH